MLPKVTDDAQAVWQRSNVLPTLDGANAAYLQASVTAAWQREYRAVYHNLARARV